MRAHALADAQSELDLVIEADVVAERHEDIEFDPAMARAPVSEAWRRLKAVLTPDQQRAWEVAFRPEWLHTALLLEPFQVPGQREMRQQTQHVSVPAAQ